MFPDMALKTPFIVTLGLVAVVTYALSQTAWGRPVYAVAVMTGAITTADEVRS